MQRSITLAAHSVHVRPRLEKHRSDLERRERLDSLAFVAEAANAAGEV